ncbi:MAG: c-type cytochrome [Alphaproteobacteria bacterium]|nr:c-type cytochrome [Alphaproteobacteria bacterium]
MNRLSLSLLTLLTIGCFTTGPSGAQTSNPADGQLAYNNNCRTCHSLDEGDNRLGPNLHQIVGRKAAAASGYGYSSAFKSADFEWTTEKLDQFIADPNAVVPGNNMKPYSGIADAKVRSAIVEHLKSQ